MDMGLDDPPMTWGRTQYLDDVGYTPYCVAHAKTRCSKPNLFMTYLVGGIYLPPLKNDGVRQLGWWNSQYDGKVIKIHILTMYFHWLTIYLWLTNVNHQADIMGGKIVQMLWRRKCGQWPILVGRDAADWISNSEMNSNYKQSMIIVNSCPYIYDIFNILIIYIIVTMYYMIIYNN